MLPALTSRFSGLYARSVYLPASILGREFRALSRRVRKVERGQSTSLPVAGWRDVTSPAPIRLVETRKNSGDVNLAELAVLASAAAERPEFAAQNGSGQIDQARVEAAEPARQPRQHAA